MTNNTKQNGILQAILEFPQKIIRYVSSAAVRIFSPRDDNYPETGVQPFEGEPPKKKDY
ncbi:hypothetical protein ACF3DV_30320 [Chlorogloeopsis fritschii PCC 9212]|jgi:hypothetical protein|uniref:Menaquinone-specific isochorismate synthase n=1 Tax=Chlorogloeopsis fritschii PCC 6912 TaxID=211165 RepID=A0A3S1A2Q9_CHLFR|nr:hypothetical protein [Chlorogloeopsis fritschii]MBF2005109.1 hypothetical protein [Chlorogloeopsis fritschii C42_A2020_084]RUR84196.1 hypothetical protein PCC6912_17900 [Chlorogloeopsis fritschii PCC 6912]